MWQNKSMTAGFHQLSGHYLPQKMQPTKKSLKNSLWSVSTGDQNQTHFSKQLSRDEETKLHW